MGESIRFSLRTSKRANFGAPPGLPGDGHFLESGVKLKRVSLIFGLTASGEIRESVTLVADFTGARRAREFEASFRAETPLWVKIINNAGVKLD